MQVNILYLFRLTWGKQSRQNIELLKKDNKWIEDKSSSPDFLVIKHVI